MPTKTPVKKKTTARKKKKAKQAQGTTANAWRKEEEAERETLEFIQAVDRYKRRTQKARQSSLDNIPGIGPRRKRVLLTHYGDIDGIRRASIEELTALPGMNRAAAVSIQRHL